MDSRKPPYVTTAATAAAAPAPPPHPHYPSHLDSRPPPAHHYYPQQQHHQQQPPQQHTVAPPPPLPQPQHPQGPPHHYPHHQHPPPPPPPPPPPSAPVYAGAPHLPPQQGTTLPPIQSPTYAPTASTAEHYNLPSLRRPSSSPHETRDASEHPDHPPQYHQPTRSGHETSAPVNRSYSHESMHQRTPSTPVGPPSHYPPHTPVTQDGPPPSYPPYAVESGGYHGYPPTNGVPHGYQYPPPPPPPHHEPHPQYMNPTQDHHHHHGYPPPGPPVYNAGGYPAPPGGMYGTKRKQMRATQACEQCRQRKQKCDEGIPCSFCKETGLACQYRDTPPAKTDKNMEKLLNYMEAHSNGLREIMMKIETFEPRLHRLELHQTSDQAAARSTPDPKPIDDAASQDQIDGRTDDHRTAPHKLLLLWPSVRPLLSKANVHHNDGYVMEAEDRGVLRLWTRGEGIDDYDGTHPGGAGSPAPSDDSSEPPFATIPYADGLWGTGFPQTPSGDIRRSEPNGVGGLKPNGEVDLDIGTINSLYDSYMRHMYIMHPFLDKRRLRKMFDAFIRRYSTGRPKAFFAVSQTGSVEPERPLKRKRSNGSATNASSDSEWRKEPTERSPGNAIVYLVLALGKICQHQEPLPAIAPDSRVKVNATISHQLSGARLYGSSPAPSYSIKPSPMSPKSTPTTQPTPPSEGPGIRHESRSRRSSMDGGTPTAQPRNLDVIPGIAYYAKAAEILGDQGDGNDLVHAQMFLLAGLYKGQLGRVKESMSWITRAGRAIITLVQRYKLFNDAYWTTHGDIRKQHERGQMLIKDTRHALIVLAAWTSVQLESDILAEVQLPSSGIQSIENKLLMPNSPDYAQFHDGVEPYEKHESWDTIMMSFSSQLFLRRRLNQIHRQLYGPECLSQPLSEVKATLRGHEDTLNEWKNSLPGMLSWNDEDPLPSEILAARLRAKYWGTRYIINRPYLDYALHILPHVKDGYTVEQAAVDGYGKPRDKADIHLFKAIQQMEEGEVFQAAKRCIEAAMQSTVAFDGVPGRLVVTNIHGTAHAQFGNMLVLSATFYNKSLNYLVPQERFEKLMGRTIKFLRRLSPISPTCAADCGILEKFSNILFGVPDDVKHVYYNEGVEPTNGSSAPSSASTSFNAST